MNQETHDRQVQLDRPESPLLIVLSGPSGAGKDAVLSRMRESGYPLKYITTVTTRPQRPNERNDIDYHFASTDEFQEMISRNELLEWANVYGNWYGVPGQPVREALGQGKDTIVKVDIQGVATIKQIAPEAVFIFLTSPSMDEVALRLKQRHTESDSDLDLRIKTAREEIKQLPLFDYIIANRQGKIELAASDLKAIITAEKCRLKPRRVAL